MKDRLILFSAPMIRAIRADRKTMTRRVLKPQPPCGVPREVVWGPEAAKLSCGQPAEHAYAGFDLSGTGELSYFQCPYGAPGDRLWVRERWRTYASLDHLPPRDIAAGAGIEYSAGGTSIAGEDTLAGMGRWRAGFHMPRWASRLTLEVTAVRVERVQDISGPDCCAEGLLLYGVNEGPPMKGDQWKRHRDGYRLLWDSLNAARGFPWASNPWVWVITFRRVEVVP